MRGPPRGAADARSTPTPLGDADAGVAISIACSNAGCDASVSAVLLPGLGSVADAVEAATNSAVVTLAQDAGGEPTCETDFIGCVGRDPTEQGVERCQAEAATCGFTGDAGPRLACSAQFAQCFLADWFAYQRCIAVFRACEASFSEG